MKKITLSIIIILFSSPGLFNRLGMGTSNLYAARKTSNYLFGDQVYLRRKPSKAGEPLTKLSVGTDVRILQRTSSKLKIGNITDYWYKIDAGGTIGYLWGGLLASAAIEADLDGDGKKEVFLARVSYKGENPAGGPPSKTVIEIRVARYGKILAEYKNSLKGGYSLLKTRFFQRNDLKPKGRFISLEFDFYYEVGGTCVILYTRQKDGIHRALKFNSAEGEGGFMCQRTLAFPSKSGRANILRIKSKCADMSDCTGKSGEKPCKYERSETSYKWNGSEFEKIR